MCGIVAFSGRFSRPALQGATEALGHRGPDGSGLYFSEDDQIGLGHTRLAIVDVSPLGAQPMASNDGQVVLTYNGEIYNHLELRAELEALGHRFKGHSDTETILRMYLQYGEQMLVRLNGIFALALWDNRSKSLLVARDGLGVKPLYIYEGQQGIALASEIKSLKHLCPALQELDGEAIHRYMTFLWCPGPGTPFKAARKIGPGEALTISAGRVARSWTWYVLPALRTGPRAMSADEAVANTVSHLRRAVHRQLMADVPVGAFLSGGLDSSAIVAFARERSPDLRCFSIEIGGGQDAGVTEDLPYARQVASHLGVQLDVVPVDARDMLADLELLVGQLDEPLADPAPLNVLYISQLARKNGIKVLLSGAGGDDLFTGYRRHRALGLDRLWGWVPDGARRALEAASNSLDLRNGLQRKAAKYLVGAGESGDARLIGYFRWMPDQRLRALYAPDFRAAIAHSASEQPFIDYLGQMPPGSTALQKMLALEQRFFLTDHNLLYTDKMSMAAGVETRVPFLDLDLVEFAGTIPDALKQRGKEGKWVLKKAMEPFLPHDIIYRPKSGFGAPIRRWMLHELKPMIAEMLSASSLRRRGIFDPVAVQNLIDRNAEGRVDASYTLLSMMCIEIWCRANIDRVS